MKNQPLFSEFKSVSSKEWKQKIQFDLKGADYNDTLVWQSLEGIKVKPFYHNEDLENKPTFSLPKDHSWQIGQYIYSGNTILANEKALNVLQWGAESIIFRIPDAVIDFNQLLRGIDLKTTPIQFQFEALDSKQLKLLLAITEKPDSKTMLNIDLLGNLARTGNWFHSQKKDHQILNEILQVNKGERLVFSVDTSLYQNAGANMVQQLAYGLSHAHEYLNHTQSVTSSVVNKSQEFTFKVAVGSNYFFEIAKLRALRWLWQTLAAAYTIETECHILAVPTKRNKTLYDFNVNMLRTTSECMAAVLGGANTICNLPYDAMYHKDNEFGERISRNQLLLLKEESYFDEAIHAAEGTYYIETITNQLAEKALALFKQIEKVGGFLKQMHEGTIQRKIKESAEKEQILFDTGDITAIGTNKYENPNDKMLQELELYPFVKTAKRKTIIAPIIEKRLAEKIEQQRLKNEKK
jgi:methylmalonyl-CoA mutase